MKNQKILIIGGTGSLGMALVRRLAKDNELFIASRDELKQWVLKNDPRSAGVRFFVADMRDKSRMEEVILGVRPTIILIAAALKQVDTCEAAPGESIKTNVLGVQNVVDLVERHEHKLSALKTVVMISTDKACEPVNVYGMSKAIAERIVASKSYTADQVKYVVVRYGNVLDSRGSILPLFRYQAEQGEAFTITHPAMTRFIMTLDESIDLILHAAQEGRSGETWIPRLKSMRIGDLAAIFSERFGKPVKTIGIRPGEKLDEVLIARPESLRCHSENGFYVLAASMATVSDSAEPFAYTSADDVVDRASLEDYLESLGLLTLSSDRFVGQSFDEIRRH